MSTTYPANADSEKIAAAFDAFAAAIGGYGWASDLWEDHLDGVLDALREYGHYPADPEQEGDEHP